MFDVGANTGQFARELRTERYKGRIISFEPLGSCHEMLSLAAEHDQNWFVAPPMALGAKKGEAEMLVAENLVSSSLLPVVEKSINAAPHSRQVSREMVTVHRLDSIVDDQWEPPFAIKVDTQGFEMQVLQGAEDILARTVLLLLEMSLVPLYQGGSAFADLYLAMERRGFRCIGLTQGFADLQRNEQLQADALFVRN